MKRVMFLGVLILSWPDTQVLAKPQPTVKSEVLDARARDRLHYRLDNRLRELHSLVNNRKSDTQDRERLEREFRQLDIYERIPMKEDRAGLKKELRRSGLSHGITLISLGRANNGPVLRPRVIPVSLHIDDPFFRLKDDEVAESLVYQLVVKLPDMGVLSATEQVSGWVRKWSEEIERLIVAGETRHLSGDLWEIRLTAFRFRSEVRYPQLLIRDPLVSLPDWARKNPTQFRKQEPALWKYVQEIRNLRPMAEPGLRLRSEAMLLQSRLGFFMSQLQRVSR